MRVPDGSPATVNARCLLGTYEMELHDIIERLIAGGFRTIVNCGAGQGYYGIGFALRCQDARVIAFETLAGGRQEIRSGAELNQVADRVTVREQCDAAALRDCLTSPRSPVLLIVDIEGAELAVFDAEWAVQLADATLLIETHDHRMPGTSDRLRARFAATHQVEVCAPRDRTRRDLPPAVSSGLWRALSWLLVWLMKEPRAHTQQWLLFTPRRGQLVNEATPTGRVQ
jgi:hypothetical protein